MHADKVLWAFSVVWVMRVSMHPSQGYDIRDTQVLGLGPFDVNQQPLN